MQGQTDPVTRASGSPQRLAEMIGIRKSFPGVQAIRSADFELLEGEIHALVGENGAGKSTLVKVLTGVHRADAGEIRLLDQPVDFHTPLDAQLAGIATIYQEFTLVPTLSVSANIFLGNESTRYTVIDSRREREATTEHLARLGSSIDPSILVSELSPAQQQLVEIARALARNARILVMDEPTAALAPREVAHLFDILRELTARSLGIMFISHRLDEVLAIAHRITVMRDGETVTTSPTSQMSRTRLIELMVGRPIDQEYPKRAVQIGQTCFEVRHLSGERVHDVSFTVRTGEILGLAGLMGAGRTDVARLIFGADPKASGEILLHGEPVCIDSPRDAIRAGICLLTEDRKLQGLVLKASAKDNFALPNLGLWSRFGWIHQRRESQRFADRVTSLGIRVANSVQRAEELSGGNQQKLLVARWLETNSQVIMFDEPTRGIDVGAKYDMYLLIGELAAQGKAIVVISSELPELLGICDRILVMRRGHISGVIPDARAATQEEIMALAV
jgi:ribose transport system ATP-binding protein